MVSHLSLSLILSRWLACMHRRTSRRYVHTIGHDRARLSPNTARESVYKSCMYVRTYVCMCVHRRTCARTSPTLYRVIDALHRASQWTPPPRTHRLPIAFEKGSTLSVCPLHPRASFVFRFFRPSPSQRRLRETKIELDHSAICHGSSAGYSLSGYHENFGAERLAESSFANSRFKSRTTNDLERTGLENVGIRRRIVSERRPLSRFFARPSFAFDYRRRRQSLGVQWTG